MPTVVSSVRASSNPSHASSVDFTVTFSTVVTGVDASDFSLATNLSGAFISTVSGSGTTYTVSVNTGTGSGTLRLDVIDDDSILDAISTQLGGSGTGNGNYSGGESYTSIRSPRMLRRACLKVPPPPTQPA